LNGCKYPKLFPLINYFCPDVIKRRFLSCAIYEEPPVPDIIFVSKSFLWPAMADEID